MAIVGVLVVLGLVFLILFLLWRDSQSTPSRSYTSSLSSSTERFSPSLNRTYTNSPDQTKSSSDSQTLTNQFFQSVESAYDTNSSDQTESSGANGNILLPAKSNSSNSSSTTTSTSTGSGSNDEYDSDFQKEFWNNSLLVCTGLSANYFGLETVKNAINYCMKNGAGVNFSSGSVTPLIRAVTNRDDKRGLAITKFLVGDKKANVNFTGVEDYITPLMCAVDNSEIVKYLIDKGAFVNCSCVVVPHDNILFEEDLNEKEVTALSIAAFRGNVESVKALLKGGASTMETRETRGVLSPIKAVNKGKVKRWFPISDREYQDIYDCLTKWGNNTTPLGKCNNNLETDSKKINFWHTLLLLYCGDSLHPWCRNKVLRTAFRKCIERGASLAASPPNITLWKPLTSTLFHYLFNDMICFKENTMTRMAQFLIKHGALNQNIEYKITALQMASRTGNFEMVKWLIRNRKNEDIEQYVNQSVILDKSELLQLYSGYPFLGYPHSYKMRIIELIEPLADRKWTARTFCALCPWEIDDIVEFLSKKEAINFDNKKDYVSFKEASNLKEHIENIGDRKYKLSADEDALSSANSNISNSSSTTTSTPTHETHASTSTDSSSNDERDWTKSPLFAFLRKPTNDASKTNQVVSEESNLHNNTSVSNSDEDDRNSDNDNDNRYNHWESIETNEVNSSDLNDIFSGERFGSVAKQSSVAEQLFM